MALRFGEFEFDEPRRELRRQGRPVPLQPRAFDVLAVLLRERDRVVARQELLAEVWPGETVTESALAFSIRSVRKAVGDTGKTQRVIKTLHGRGFRFVAPVESSKEAITSPTSATSSDRADERSDSGRTSRRVWRSVVAPKRTGPFIGRAEELDRIDAEIQRALDGETRALLLIGEPGIGKTRLAVEAAARAEERGFVVHAGRCDEETPPVFWPWVQVVRAALAGLPTDEARDLLGAGGPEIARIVPAARQLVAPAAARAVDAEAARLRLFDSMTSFLFRLATRVPAVVLLDDLQWADSSTVLLLRNVLAEVPRAPLLVLATARTSEPDAKHAAAELIASADRFPGLLPLHVDGLALDEAEALLDARSERGLADGVASDLYELTHGNPFFLEETLHHLMSSTASSDAPDEIRAATLAEVGISHEVREAVHHRIGRASDDAREVLTAAAVLGTEFRAGLLESVCTRPPATVLDALEEATDRGLVEESGSGVDQYRFSHALVREALLADAGPLTRATLHERAGLALERLAPGDGERLPELAHHFFEATPLGKPERAVDYVARAGRQADAHLAFDDAVACFARALEAEAAIDPPDPLRRGDLLAELGSVSAKTGRGDATRRAYREAARLALEARSPELLARAAIGLALRWTQADEKIVSMHEQALAELPSGAPVDLRARIRSSLGSSLALVPGTRPRREELLDEALMMARDSGNRRLLCEVLEDGCYALCHDDALETRTAMSSELQDLGSVDDDLEMNSTAMAWCITNHLQAGDLAAVDRWHRALLGLQDVSRWPVLRFMGAFVSASRALLAGRLVEAEQHALEALEVGTPLNAMTAQLIFSSQIFRIRAEEGRAAEMAETIEAFLGGEVSVWSWQLASFYEWTNQPDRARETFEQVAANQFACLPLDLSYNARLPALFAASEVCGYLEDRDRAEFLHAELAPYADHWAVQGLASACAGQIRLPLGILCRVLERWEECFAHLDRALAAHDVDAARVPAISTRIEYARARRARGGEGDRSEAERLLNEAETLARERGLTGQLTRVAHARRS